MFLGYQNGLITFIAETREELENIPLVSLDRIEETSEPVELVAGKYYLGRYNIEVAKQEDVRAYRNRLLETEIDPVVSNPLRWNDMYEEDKQKYIDYRLYLLNYTTTKDWWLQYPKTMEEWKRLK